MISVNEIGLSWEHELIEFSFGLGITALFQTFGIFPLFREVLNILVITGVNITAYVFQNQYGMLSGRDVVRFNFRKKLCTMSNESEVILVSLGIDSNCGAVYSGSVFMP
jgi:hypothetical protein